MNRPLRRAGPSQTRSISRKTAHGATTSLSSNWPQPPMMFSGRREYEKPPPVCSTQMARIRTMAHSRAARSHQIMPRRWGAGAPGASAAISFALMRPALTAFDLGHIGLRNSIIGGDNPLQPDIASYCKNIISSEFSQPGSFSSSATSFFNGISHIVDIRSRRKMIWTHAGRIVTGMHEEQTGWDFPDFSFKEISVCLHRHNLSWKPKMAIPILIAVAEPYPAITGFINARIKRFVRRNFAKRIESPRSLRSDIVQIADCRDLARRPQIMQKMGSIGFRAIGIYLPK